MLQIFIRPEAADLEPGIQFVDLDETKRIDVAAAGWACLFSGAEFRPPDPTAAEASICHQFRDLIAGFMFSVAISLLANGRPERIGR